MLQGVAVAVLIAACQPIANMPVELRDEIDQAAQALADGFDDPGDATFEFVDIHCRADGSMLIEFKATSGPDVDGVATATSSGDERRPWELVYAPENLDGDIAAFFTAAPEVACPPGPG